MRLEKTVDETELSAHDAAAIAECLAAPSLSKPASKPGPPDRFCYTLTVDDGGGGGGARRSVSFREGEEPPSIRPLIASLKRSPAG
jgi:hypothetical protein